MPVMQPLLRVVNLEQCVAAQHTLLPYQGSTANVNKGSTAIDKLQRFLGLCGVSCCSSSALTTFSSP